MKLIGYLLAGLYLHLGGCAAKPLPIEYDSIFFSPLTHPHDQYGHSIATDQNVLVISNNAMQPNIFAYSIRNEKVEDLLQSDDDIDNYSYSSIYTYRDDDGSNGRSEDSAEEDKRNLYLTENSNEFTSDINQQIPTTTETTTHSISNGETNSSNAGPHLRPVYWVEKEPHQYTPDDPTVSGMNSVVDINTISTSTLLEEEVLSWNKSNISSVNGTDAQTLIVRNDTRTTIVAGYPERIGCVSTSCAGVVYIYTEIEMLQITTVEATNFNIISNYTVSTKQQILSDPKANQEHTSGKFGISVTIADTVLVVGANEWNHIPTSSRVTEPDDADWTEEAEGTIAALVRDMGGGQAHTGYKTGTCHLYTYSTLNDEWVHWASLYPSSPPYKGGRVSTADLNTTTPSLDTEESNTTSSSSNVTSATIPTTNDQFGGSVATCMLKPIQVPLINPYSADDNWESETYQYVLEMHTLIAVGAKGDSTNHTEQGAVYIYSIAHTETFLMQNSTQTNTLLSATTDTLRLLHKLIPATELTDYSHFGSQVALSNNHGVFSHIGLDGTSAVYLYLDLYRADDSGLPSYQILTPVSQAYKFSPFSQYGASLSFQGNAIAVGAPYTTCGGDSAATEVGAVYLWNIDMNDEQTSRSGVLKRILHYDEQGNREQHPLTTLYEEPLLDTDIFNADAVQYCKSDGIATGYGASVAMAGTSVFVGAPWGSNIHAWATNPSFHPPVHQVRNHTGIVLLERGVSMENNTIVDIEVPDDTTDPADDDTTSEQIEATSDAYSYSTYEIAAMICGMLLLVPGSLMTSFILYRRVKTTYTPSGKSVHSHSPLPEDENEMHLLPTGIHTRDSGMDTNSNTNPIRGGHHLHPSTAYPEPKPGVLYGDTSVLSV